MKKAFAAVALCVGMTGFALARTPSESTHAAIVSAMQGRMHVPVLIVGPMAQEGNYILTRWSTGDNNSAGEALAKYDGFKWKIVQSSGGTMEKGRYLESIGVPPATALALVNDMKKL